MTCLASYVPFLNPINFFHEWWWLLIVPLSFGISVIYKAVRMPTLRGYWRQVAIMTVQVVLAMAALGVALIILVTVLIPLIPAE